MTKITKTEKIILNPYGKHLSTNKISFIVKNKKEQLEKIPFYKVSEIVLTTGNSVSTNALFWASIYDIDILLLSPTGKPLGMFKSLKNNTHVKTRVCQYEAYRNRKGVEIAKQFVLGKIDAQTEILKKHRLLPFEASELPSKEVISRFYGKNVDSIRHKLTTIEAHYTKHYFNQIFKLFPKNLRVKRRESLGAYEPLNNLLNLAYEILAWKILKALTKAKLEPNLGFLHSIQPHKPSLVCDFQELYRSFIDDFLINYTKNLKRKDFKHEYGRAKTPRMFLKHPQSSHLIQALNNFFETRVNIQRIKKHGRKQKLETLINEETRLIAKYIRNEKPSWEPRIPTI